jgi:hypothetical protein
MALRWIACPSRDQIVEGHAEASCNRLESSGSTALSGSLDTRDIRLAHARRAGERRLGHSPEAADRPDRVHASLDALPNGFVKGSCPIGAGDEPPRLAILDDLGTGEQILVIAPRDNDELLALGCNNRLNCGHQRLVLAVDISPTTDRPHGDLIDRFDEHHAVVSQSQACTRLSRKLPKISSTPPSMAPKYRYEAKLKFVRQFPELVADSTRESDNLRQRPIAEGDDAIIAFSDTLHNSGECVRGPSGRLGNWEPRP